ncbi:MAG: antirestriction protein ArdA [Zavarzinia sp.]|nr:antirestriction protein ArdA [Zavarzinia sp.]
MTTTLFAQPYDISATGFYFETIEEYEACAAKAVNAYGQPVEEFEIQFIDGERIDCELAEAIGLTQGNLRAFLECVDAWEDWQKTNVIIAVGECGYPFDPKTDPQDYDVDVYAAESLRDLAMQFVDEGLFGEVPKPLAYYIDYDAIAHDLGTEYVETVIAGERIVYACR